MTKRLTVQLADDSGQWTDSIYLDDPIRAVQFAWTMASTNPRVKASRVIDTHTGQLWLQIIVGFVMKKRH